jgi:hypothetical protein
VIEPGPEKLMLFDEAAAKEPVSPFEVATRLPVIPSVEMDEGTARVTPAGKLEKLTRIHVAKFASPGIAPGIWLVQPEGVGWRMVCDSVLIPF